MRSTTASGICDPVLLHLHQPPPHQPPRARRSSTVDQVTIDDLPDGWTRRQLKSYESIRDEQGTCMVELHGSGRILIHPDAAKLLGVVPDTWGADSARPTWGTVYA